MLQGLHLQGSGDDEATQILVVLRFQARLGPTIVFADGQIFPVRPHAAVLMIEGVLVHDVAEPCLTHRILGQPPNQ